MNRYFLLGLMGLGLLAMLPAEARNHNRNNHSAHCSRVAHEYARRNSGSHAVTGAARGAVGGAIIGGIVDGGSGASRGALIGGGVGLIAGSTYSNQRDYDRLYNAEFRRCMNRRR